MVDSNESCSFSFPRYQQVYLIISQFVNRKLLISDFPIFLIKEDHKEMQKLSPSSAKGKKWVWETDLSIGHPLIIVHFCLGHFWIAIYFRSKTRDLTNPWKPRISLKIPLQTVKHQFCQVQNMLLPRPNQQPKTI